MVGKSSPPSATKLPATAHGRRTRAAIIDAAARMMYQKGVAATSLDDILAASSTGKSQLYHYFKDRSELVKAVVERQTELVLAAQPTLTQIDSMDGVEQWAQAILANHDVPGGPFGSMAAELKNDPAYQPALAAAFGQWQSLLADGLIRMQDRGHLDRREDPQRLAAAVLATLQGGMLMGRATMDITVLRDSLEMALDSIRRALRD
ncbi:TetR/AcrR family transcriptional regulator [Mycobacteroides abscessus]|uniref:TetR/AcrR family transcriptional regulator n=1 Tax=Mycobacteroides abscessus TaxID=36809 RepID=UPI0019D0A682|nr:TetR/AcrR family transcriptional regulator [Mycobacteroides abscessus]MBN7451309.1 TetR/AcrR family transcriptional regulator [Mycobacteroides abscessus subsp. abscessus]